MGGLSGALRQGAGCRPKGRRYKTIKAPHFVAAAFRRAAFFMEFAPTLLNLLVLPTLALRYGRFERRVETRSGMPA